MLAERHVVTCFLVRCGEDGDRVLLVRRSAGVSSYAGAWGAISGAIEGADPLADAIREIEEETALPAAAVTLTRVGPPLVVPDATLGRRWVVHPFLFRLAAGHEPRLNWENVDYRWTTPAELTRLPTVPRLAEALAAVYEPAAD